MAIGDLRQFHVVPALDNGSGEFSEHAGARRLKNMLERDVVFVHRSS